MWFAYLLTVVSMANGLSPTTTDAPIVNSSLGCILDGKIHPVGSFTPVDRCQGYRCLNDGTWEYDKTWPTKCYECSTSGNTAIKMYRDHSINGSSISSYEFERSAKSYTLTRHGVDTSSKLGVNATFEYTNPSATKSSITKVVYKEPGITVEFDSPGPSHDAKLLVNGVEKPRLNHNGSMTPFYTGTGWVYISNHSPNWPRPNFGGNIHIVGTRGLAVSIYALHGYAHFVHIYAMDNMNNLYGLCDVITLKGIVPDYFTERSGKLTNSTDDFIDSWKDGVPTDNRSSNDESPDEDESAIPPWWGSCGGFEIGGCGDGHCIPFGRECTRPLDHCLCNSTIPENFYCCGSPIV